MVGHGGSSAGSYLADPTSPIPSHCVSIVVTSTLRVNVFCFVCVVGILPSCQDYRYAGYETTYTYLVDPDGADNGKRSNVPYFALHCYMPVDQPVGIAIVGHDHGVGPGPVSTCILCSTVIP